MAGGQFFDSAEIAAMLSAEHSSVCRALATLEKRRIVFRNGRQWTREQPRVIRDRIAKNHYLKSTPTRPVFWFEYQGAMMCFASPAGRNVSLSLTGKPNAVLELSRLWAPDNHEPNLLTRAISEAIKALRKAHPQCEAIIAYSDPAECHHGGIYRAASWVQIGETDGRQRVNGYGDRRHGRPKARFARGLTRAARRAIAARATATATISVSPHRREGRAAALAHGLDGVAGHACRISLRDCGRL
jgi:hypothetical protein